MATLYTPPETPEPGQPPVVEYRRTSADERVEFMPVLLAQLQDDLARSRKREAFWISVIVHIVAVLLIAFSPKYMPQSHPVQVATAEDLIRNRELTYLEAPADKQTPPAKPPDTRFMSDKNRIATSRNPSIDKKTLDELRDSRRPGTPQPPGPPAQQAQRAAAPTPPAPESQGAQAQQGSPAQASNTPSQLLNLPPARPSGGQQPNPFGGAMSAGTAIAEAARNSARSGGAGGSSGEYGLGPGASPGKIRSDMDVLSDTMGVDFGPYLSRVLQSVRMHWYDLIPEVARPPLLKKGKVAIEFVILKDGRVAGMQIKSPSGDISLDRAAWGGITGSNPFSPLPSEFRGPYLALRFHFYYNPDRNDLQ